MVISFSVVDVCYGTADTLGVALASGGEDFIDEGLC